MVIDGMMITKPDFLPAHTKWYSAPDRTQLSSDLSQYLTDELQRVLVHNQRASLALSGGRTSIPLLQALAQESLPWQNIEITLTDERWVDEDHNDSNAALVQRYLLQGPASSACFIPLKNQATSNSCTTAAPLFSKTACLDRPGAVCPQGPP